MVVLIGLNLPFTKFIKCFSPWCKEKKCGLWSLALQSEKGGILGLAAFFTNMMDMELLKGAIVDHIHDVPDCEPLVEDVHLGTRVK